MTPIFPKLPRLLPILLLLFGQSGCAAWLGSGDAGKHPTIYAPIPHLALDRSGPMLAASLLIAAPKAAPMLDSERIVIRLDDDELQFLRGARWSRRAPEMLQDALLHLLEDSGRAQVARHDSGFAADWLLIMDLRRFEADYSQGSVPNIKIEISAKLLNRQDKNVIAWHTFSHSETAAASSTQAIINALTEGLSQTTLELAGWVFKAPPPSVEGMEKGHNKTVETP